MTTPKTAHIPGLVTRRYSVSFSGDEILSSVFSRKRLFCLLLSCSKRLPSVSFLRDHFPIIFSVLLSSSERVFKMNSLGWSRSSSTHLVRIAIHPCERYHVW